MGLIIKNKGHYLTRFPSWLLAKFLVALSPFIIGFTGAFFSELIYNETCHEGNCFWMVIPGLGIITIPIGTILLII